MRTTVTLDPDTEQIVRARMAAEGVSFKQALNEALRESAHRRRPAEPFETPVFPSMGRPKVDLTKALQLAGELEDEDVIAKLGLRR